MNFAHELLLEFARAEDAGDPFAFRAGIQTYLLRGAGGGFESVELSWNQALLADLAVLHETRRDPAVVQRVGETLRRFLEPAGWARQEARLTEAVARGQPVVVTVRSAAAELYALPWELLTLKTSGQHLGELPDVLVRYEWPETATVAESPSPRPEGGRVLFAWSRAGGNVPDKAHLLALQEGAKAGHHAFEPSRDVLANASYAGLQDALEAASAPGGTPISVLHLLCHGGAVGQTVGLVLDSEEGDEPVVVDAGRLRQLLAPHADRVRLVVLAACNGGNIGVLGNHLGSIAQTLHRAGLAAVIASRFPFSIPGSNRFSETFYRQLLGGPSSVEGAFLAARRQLARDTGRLDWASVQLYARAADGDDSRPIVLRPYRGLLAFQPEHNRFFFGRDAEVTEIIDDLGALTRAGAPRFLAVAGASGTGKSSVVLAGAVPRLLQAPGSQWVLARMRPGSEPLAALEAALATRTDLARPLLLVVDQFEEVFTQTESGETRNAFVRRLWALAREADSGVSVIITLRVDFIGHCGELSLDESGPRLDKVAYDEAHRVFVAQLGPAQLEEAITRPAGLAGLTLEAGLARRMLKDVDGEPGALPLLQDTLDLLWQRRQGRTLTQAAYDEVGGVTGALQRRADAQLAGLGEAGEKLARRLLVRLVSARTDTAIDTRRRAPLEELRPHDPESQAHFEKILDQFVDERLLVRTNEGEAASVEVAHEALIRKWPRLGEWVLEDREKITKLHRVRAWVEEWKTHGMLLVEAQLALVKEIEEHFPEELDTDARRMVKQSRTRARRKRWLHRFGRVGGLVTAAAVLVAFLVTASIYYTMHYMAFVAFRNSTETRDARRILASLRVDDPKSALSILREVKLDWMVYSGWLDDNPKLRSQWRYAYNRSVEALAGKARERPMADGLNAHLSEWIPCLEAKERMARLGASPESAEIGAGSCNALVECRIQNKGRVQPEGLEFSNAVLQCVNTRFIDALWVEGIPCLEAQERRDLLGESSDEAEAGARSCEEYKKCGGEGKDRRVLCEGYKELFKKEVKDRLYQTLDKEALVDYVWSSLKGLFGVGSPEEVPKGLFRFGSPAEVSKDSSLAGEPAGRSDSVAGSPAS